VAAFGATPDGYNIVDDREQFTKKKTPSLGTRLPLF